MKRVLYIGATEGCSAAERVLGDAIRLEQIEASAAIMAFRLQTAHALLDASMKVRITNEMIASAENLKIISCATTGSDHIETRELRQRGIALRTLREDSELLQSITPAAEMSWALLMACARRINAAIQHVRAGGWDREQFPGWMLNGRCLGVVGCGRIGSWMARYATAFGMDVVGYDPHITAFPQEIRPVSLRELFECSDCISIHVHLTAETKGLISEELLNEAKPGVILVNTSRGAVIDEAALLDGLKSGQISAAGLDVLVGEPDIQDHPLVQFARTHDNLLITPHCAGFSPDAVGVVCAHAAKKILEALQEC